ncbi:MAG: 23S rRNA (adenine(2030)-N(6))-methyltransferase RlmJ [Alphaproteobacteria bacterium]|nr:23S rRNA (adenine(2030)-N(6))-methyltransferase RlmJ [Alphaproteobacteria bacterium]
MNYRHAFHAGNHGDCLKHALLVWLLAAMQHKPAPLFVLDTHAGIGQYDLAATPATRTGEAQRGILRLLRNPPAALATYVALVNQLGLYPGSPALIRALLRPQDRLAACELHPEDHATLRRLFARDPQVAVHHRSAWEALGALLPPTTGEKRALVLIDPPYEAEDEFTQLATALATANRRMKGAVLAAWYPIKHRAPLRALHATLQAAGLRDIVTAELHLRAPLDPTRLNGSGLLVVNPPYGFEQAAPPILEALLARLSDNEPGAGTAFARIADE